MLRETRPFSYAILTAVFVLFVLFLYAPTFAITTLSFQGPQGGLVFPMRGFSMHWLADVFRTQSIGDIHGSFGRSIKLGLLVMLLTVVISFLAGLAFRRGFLGSGLLFYVVVASLIMPSVVVSLGIGSLFELVGIERFWWNSRPGCPPDLDAALRRADHVRGLQPLRQTLRGGGPRPRRLAAADRAARHPADRRSRRSSASPCSGSPSPTTSSPAAPRPWVPSTPCRSSCRRCRATPPRP